jgi:hypothetical protein
MLGLGHAIRHRPCRFAAAARWRQHRVNGGIHVRATDTDYYDRFFGPDAWHR